MPGRHIVDRLMECRFQEPRMFLQCRLKTCGSQLASRRLLALEAFSFACELDHFLEEWDELLFDLLRLIVRYLPVNQCVRHELLDVGDRRCNVRTFRYRLTFLAAIDRVLDLL